VLAATAFLAVLVSIAAATATFVRAATPLTVSFDFDTGTPSLSMGQSIPFNQTSGEVTAYFSSPSGSTAFSVQSDSTTFYKLSQFSGKYLYDNSPLRDSLEIKFSHYLSSITFSFATIEYRGSSGDEPSNITLTAYNDSTATTPVGSAMSRGTWPSGGESHPQGTLTFNSGSREFNLVKIEIPYQAPRSALDFLVDNIVVTTAGQVADINPPVTAIALSGVIGNQGWYTSDVAVSLSATDDWSEVAKTEYSFDNVSWTTYTDSFTVTNEGTTIIYCRSTDMAGNAEAVKTQTVKIDKTKPVAEAGQDRTVNAGETLSFDAGASSDNVGIVSYEWDCGDGTTYTGRMIAHTYNNPETYTVTLTVEDAAGNIATDSISVRVLPAPFPLWTILIIMAIGIGITVALLLRKRK